MEGARNLHSKDRQENTKTSLRSSTVIFSALSPWAKSPHLHNKTEVCVYLNVSFGISLCVYRSLRHSALTHLSSESNVSVWGRAWKSSSVTGFVESHFFPAKTFQCKNFHRRCSFIRRCAHTYGPVCSFTRLGKCQPLFAFAC